MALEGEARKRGGGEYRVGEGEKGVGEGHSQ